MLRQVKSYLLILALLLGVLAGPVMAQQKSTTQKSAARKAAPKKTPASKQLKGAVRGAEVPPMEGKSALLQYIPDDSMIIVAAQPARVINAKGFQGLLEAAGGQEVLKALLGEFEKNVGARIEQIEEVGFVMDAAGLEDMSTRAKEQAERVQALNGVRQIGLAMHNFHDSNNTFPASDGYGENKGNLSWRVHLLPYLEQTELYNEFNLDEPWDSEHNKPLIEKMPEFFKTAGVEDAGMTSYHVFTGEGAPFGGEEAPGISSFTDGTSNTIMVVVAGADEAGVWTRPGGLEIDGEDPAASLGEIGDRFVTVFADGSAKFLPSEIEASELLHLIQHQDGNVVGDYYQAPPSSEPMPGVIVCANSDFDRKALLAKLPVRNEDETMTIQSKAAYALPDGMFLTFVDSKTMLLGPENTLKAMLSPRVRSGETKAEFEGLYPANDIVAVVDLEPVEELVEQISQQMPMAPLVQNIVGLVATIDMTGASESHLNLNVDMSDNASAQQLSAIAMGGFQMIKVRALGQLSGDSSPVSEELVTALSELLESVTIEAVEESVELDIPRISDPEKFFKDVTPAFKELVKGFAESQKAASRRALTMPLRQIGLAFHNYHDTFNGLPSYCAAKNDDGVNKGLSWRVYLLPYIEEAVLYQEFHLDEPWDSDHNKTLIERMPKIFECEGVEKPGHTSLHVFTGERTPLGGDEPTTFGNITDGMSNTLMVVEAGPDKADIWTKPSGIEFNPEDPKAALGKLAETFRILFFDGSVREISSEIDDATLNRLIQHADGEVVGDF
ncbi:MAG: DUF1559 domain-containing protein [Planctomycetales bacterium]|nr:DUF1559 domain-containing protein [Planctomycetales bacterium]